MKKFLTFVVLAATLSCSTENPPPTTAVHSHSAVENSVVLKIEDSNFRAFNLDHPFQQIGIMYDAQAPLEFEENGEWKPAPVTFSEGTMRVAVVKLDAPVRSIRFRSEASFQNATFQFYPAIVQAYDGPVTHIPKNKISRALAPASLVISRAQWGSRDPNKVCGRTHTPKNISVHHTALPDNDGPDPAARMRQMQAYHIDSNGWCDIGYHFVVSQSGKIYQGISSEKRTGIHVKNHNNDNVGISLIGDYEKNTMGQPQRDALVKIMAWVAKTYQIPFEHPPIRGHREWSGQSTNCPGKNTLAILDDVILEAKTLATSPAKPCTQVVKSGGTIDNKSDCFALFGPAASWRTEDKGFDGTLHWTNMFKADAAQNYARWNINLEEGGKYRLEYYSVPEFAMYNSVKYGISHDGNETQLTIDQSAGTEGWNVLGEFTFKKGDEQWVEVYDHTPFVVPKGQHVVADAIRLTPMNPQGTNNGTNNGTHNGTSTGSGETNNNHNPNNATANLNNGTSGAHSTGNQRPNENDEIATESGCSTTQNSNSFFFLIFAFLVFSTRRKNSILK